MLAGYAVIRFGTEYLRADNHVYAFGLTISQLISVEILLFCVLAVALRRVLKARVKSPGTAPQPLAAEAPSA
jgi:prolipoprotein diacylglyceryltransferase